MLGRYVREEGVISLENAIYKMTHMPAAKFGIANRGLVKEGQWADLIVFDPTRIRDRSTYRDPHRYCEGNDWVLLNGELGLQEGKVNGHRAGRVLLKNEAVQPSN